MRQYNKVTLAKDALEASETFTNLATMTQCEGRAWRSRKSFFKYDASSKTCQIGSADYDKISNGGESVNFMARGSTKHHP